MNTTIRNNIIFDKVYNEKKFNKVIQITHLKDTVMINSQNEFTEIGEWGINLSGGQM